MHISYLTAITVNLAKRLISHLSLQILGIKYMQINASLYTNVLKDRKVRHCRKIPLVPANGHGRTLILRRTRCVVISVIHSNSRPE